MYYLAHLDDTNQLHHMWGWGGSGLMIIFWVIFWLALVALVVYLVMQWAEKETSNKPDSDESLNIAKKRYAKGEITKEEYEIIIKTLKEDNDNR